MQQQFCLIIKPYSYINSSAVTHWAFPQKLSSIKVINIVKQQNVTWPSHFKANFEM